MLLVMLQKVYVPMFYTAVGGSTSRQSERDYTPWPHWTLVHELDEAMLVFILK
jgi:hypothetical protein